MKNSIFVKFIAFVLCAVSLAAAALGGIGAVGVEGYDLHSNTPQQIADGQLEGRAENLAVFHIQEYVQEAYTNLTKNEYSRLFGTENWNYYYSSLESLEIRDQNGDLCYAINTPEAGARGHTFTLSAEYPMVLEKTVTPYSGSENAVEGIVIANSLNIRPSPSPNGEVLDQLYSGDLVMILEQRTVNGSRWGRIDKGWINLAYVSLLEDGEAYGPDDEGTITDPTEMPTSAVFETPMTGTIVVDGLDVYAEASDEGPVLKQLAEGTPVFIYEILSLDDCTWGHIGEGWVDLLYVATENGLSDATDPPVPEDTEEITAPTEIPVIPFTEEELQDEPVAMDLDLGDPLYYSEKSYSDGLNEVVYTLGYYQSPELEVTVYLDESYVLSDIQIITELHTWRDYFIPMLLAGLALFAMTFVFLCATAGRRPDGSIRPSGLNRVPLDIYLVGAIGICVACGAGLVFVIDRGGFDTDFFRTVLGLGSLGIALAVVGFCFCFAAQVKARNRYWWHHSVTGWCVDKLLRLLSRAMALLRTIGRGLRAMFRMLPVVWQWLAVTLGIPFLGAAFFFLSLCSYDFGAFLFFSLFVLCVACFIAAVCYGAYAYGILMKGVQYMAQGDLNHKVPTKYLYGTFRDFAEQLNSLGSATQIAVQRQMKSERMKTELITNVSHDIKTPLTSIINFVDLLKKPHTPEEGQQYLDVLDRQSQRLKKLIDDLMEMSKANSGNLTVELGRVDAVEAVNQALGEFSDKLDRVGLVPVFRHPETPVVMQADGRLVWRVLSNVLNNAVKYALPDTRLYIDLSTLQGNAILAIKNISRDQLNVDAEELMERFVRGDTSRNTEGSGLGLNIARSLVELQQGQMHLTVDGDLFKVTLIFPLG